MRSYPKEYFNAENRLGFPITSLMKRCWAAQTEVLDQFDSFCKSRGINYYLAYGTLLGAVRHKGFIPWDDDIDIWMYREDIKALWRNTEELAKEGLEFITPYTDPNYRNLCFRLNNTREICLDEEFLIKYWMFPFPAGLDIFPLDYIPRDSGQLNLVLQLAESANLLGMYWSNPELPDKDKMDTYLQLTEVLKIPRVPEEKIESELWQITDRVCSLYGEADADEVACFSCLSQDEKRRFDKNWFGEPRYLEFEGMFLPCPQEAEKVLEVEFGENYMTPIQAAGGDHEYPYYKRQLKMLHRRFEENRIECPEIYRGS